MEQPLHGVLINLQVFRQAWGRDCGDGLLHRGIWRWPAGTNAFCQIRGCRLRKVVGSLLVTPAIPASHRTSRFVITSVVVGYRVPVTHNTAREAAANGLALGVW